MPHHAYEFRAEHDQLTNKMLNSPCRVGSHLAYGVARQAHAHSAPLLGLAGQVVHALLRQPLARMQDERVLPRTRTPR